MSERGRLILVSSSAAALVFFVANAVETAFIQAVGPSARELTWISDAVLAAALGLATFFWLRLKSSQAEVIRLERAQIVIDTQLALAAEIQRSLLPRVPGPREGWRWAARLEPAGRIGGDFYDFLEARPGIMLVLLADVSGKGIPAALVLGATRTLFRLLARELQDPPALAARFCEALYEETGGSSYVTCILGRLDLAERRLTYVNAGHPPGVIVGPAGRRLLSKGGPPAGLFPAASYEAETLSLSHGDVGLLVTDGISEAIGGDGLDGLDRAIASLAGRVDLDSLCDEVMRLARGGPGPTAGWHDDRTVVAFRVDGEPGEGAADQG